MSPAAISAIANAAMVIALARYGLRAWIAWLGRRADVGGCRRG